MKITQVAKITGASVLTMLILMPTPFSEKPVLGQSAEFPRTPSAPPGASRAFVSNDPVIVEAVRLMRLGKFADAERRTDDPTLTDPRAREELLQIIARTRNEYSQSEGALLEKLRKSIPDVTTEDLRRWRDAKQAQFRVIDGEIFYFRREPGQLLRFCPEVMDRVAARTAREHPSTSPAAPAPGQASEWDLTSHLVRILAATSTTGGPHVLPVKHNIRYRLTVPPNDRFKPGAVVRAWLPFPQEYRQQKDVRLVRSEPAGAVVSAVGVDGDPVPAGAHRSVYLERTINDPSSPQTFEIEFEFTSSAYYPKLDDAAAQPLKVASDRPAPGSANSTYLAERLPHIAFTPELRAVVDRVVGGETNQLKKARLLFNWVDEHLPWTPEEEYSTIPSLCMHGFERGKGDCGVATMLYITLCRIAGVPARWQSGFVTNPVGWNMHDWAEIYVEPWGWLPVDPSYGRQKSDDPAVRDFYFGHTDSYRLIVNLDYGRTLSPPEKGFRSEPADFQRGEVEIDGTNLYFSGWDWDIEFSYDQKR